MSDDPILPPPTHKSSNSDATLSSIFDSSMCLQQTGSVLRFDEMTGTWVVFAAGRSNRPRQTKSNDAIQLLEDLPPIVHDCPFCQGNEHMTPDVLFTRGSMRVVHNKYPAVDPMHRHPPHPSRGPPPPTPPPHRAVRSPMLQRRRSNNMADIATTAAEIHYETPAVGFHEVVIESPFHNAHIATSPDVTHALDLLVCFRERGRAHRAQYAEDGVEHTVYFKNHGATAGASLVHPHAQIVSTPVVPVEAQRLQSLALAYFQKHNVSLYERIVEEEIHPHHHHPPPPFMEDVNSNPEDYGFGSAQNSSRMVDASPHFVSMVPFAGPGPYVITILPRFGAELMPDVDCSDFTSTSDALLEECADILRKALQRLQLLLHEPCFNLVVQSAPVGDRGVQAAFRAATYFRWHIRITPRLGAGAMAGFELGSGFFSNSHLPEQDAAELRAVSLPE